MNLAKSHTMPNLPKWQITLLAGMAIILASKLLRGEFIAETTILQVGTVLIAVGAGFALGWLCSPHGKVARIWAMVVTLLLFAYVALGKPGPAGWSLTSLAATVGFFGGFFYLIGAGVKAMTSRPITFGSAEWASLFYLEQNGLIGTSGFRLGQYNTPDKIAPLHYDGDRHLLTVAPTRAEKGVSAIIPNLLTYTGSALVIDPKGENAMITAAQRLRMGQEVHIVDPWGIAAGGQTARFNPLDWLNPDDIDSTENAMLLADALVVQDGSGDKFWNEEAKALLQGLILYVATDPHEEGNRTLPRVRDLLLMDGDDTKLLYERMVDSPHHVVASTGARCLQKEEKLMANVIASAQAHTHFLDSARLRENLSASDFKFEDLKTKPMTIYLVLPADRLDSFNRWLRLLIQQAITVNARNIELKPAKPILFLLDEMAALGKLKMVHQAFGLMAGFGMQLWGIVQDLGQLKSIYGEGGYETLISNSGCIQYFGSRDRLTAEYFSALCGVATVHNISTAFARAFGPGGGSGSTTETHSTLQRKLAFPDELMRMPKGQQLIFIENHNPIIAMKRRWYEDPDLRDLGRNLHKA